MKSNLKIITSSIIIITFGSFLTTSYARIHEMKKYFDRAGTSHDDKKDCVLAQWINDRQTCESNLKSCNTSKSLISKEYIKKHGKLIVDAETTNVLKFQTEDKTVKYASIERCLSALKTMYNIPAPNCSLLMKPTSQFDLSKCEQKCGKNLEELKLARNCLA